MLKYLVKRIALSLLILVAVSLIIYFLVRLMPADFVELKASSMTSDPAVADKLREQLGLSDNSFWGIIKGYFGWIRNLFTFQNGFITLGFSFDNQMPVSGKIASGLKYSFVVAVVTTIFEFMIAIPLGITAATHQYSLRDYIVTVFVMIGISLPSFFFGNAFKMVVANGGTIDTMLKGWFCDNGSWIYKIFDVFLNDDLFSKLDLSWIYKILDVFIMPPSGTGAKLEDFVLPIITVTVLSIGGRMRMTRTNMLEVLNSDYIRTARAKGLKERKVINKHAFRNTLIPLVTTLAGLLPSLFSGAIITEQVFGLMGIGQMALKASNTGDIPFIMGYNMFLAILSVLGVLLSDIMYAIVDPRVKLE